MDNEANAIDYSHYIENENENLPATSIHKHAEAGYHTTGVGEKLVPGITIDFDLADPYFNEFKPGEYSSLHDPHLKNFLNKKSVRRCLMKNKLLTKNGEVRCTLHEFNRFQRNLKHYFKTQKRIAANLDKKFYIDPRKTIRNKLKQERLPSRIQHNLKIAEARARHTEFMMRRRKQILNRIVQKDRQAAELIRRVRVERDEIASQAQIETKRRQLIKIRLDSTDIIRRCSIIRRIKQKERIVSQKMLIEKQRRIKKISTQRWEWHQERMNVKDKEFVKFLNEETDKKRSRMQSIYSRSHTSEQTKNTNSERQKYVFEEHQRIEDTHLDEAREWEKKVCDKRQKAARQWRNKMNIKQSIADGRMADLERRKCDRKKNAMARKRDQISENLEELEKMNVTVLGTTGYGSHELANIHRDASKIRFSAYYDPGRATVDPYRTTQFHSNFKPLHVIHAKYLPGLAPPRQPPPAKPRKVKFKTPHVMEIEEVEDPIQLTSGSCSSSSIVSSTATIPENLLEDLLADLLQSELEEVIEECMQSKEMKEKEDEEEEELGEGEEVEEQGANCNAHDDSLVSSLRKSFVYSNFSLTSDRETSDMDTVGDSSSVFNIDDMIADVVAKIMNCLRGTDHVYSGQTSTTDCTTRDGEAIITDIITRLIDTIQYFTSDSDLTVPESVESILSSVDSFSTRDTLKDLHKRAQFLLNHALDVAEVKLKFRGYSYMTWNILEDCLKKASDKILAENPTRVEQFSDVELVEWVMEEAKVFLQSATALLYETLHGPGQTDSPSPENKQLVEECYRDQITKAGTQAVMFDEDGALDDAVRDGDIAKFSVLLVKKTLNNAVMGIPRRSSLMLVQALKEGNYDLAGSLLAAKAITVAHRKVKLEPTQNDDGLRLREALNEGDVETAGTILATRAVQHAMDIKPEDPLEASISSMVLKNALEQGELGEASDIIVERVLKEALNYTNTPTPEVNLEDAIKFGDLEVAATIMANAALSAGLTELLSQDESRTKSSIKLDSALATGDLGTAGTILMTRALRSGCSELEQEAEMRRRSSLELEGALYKGDLPTAGDIIVRRVLKSGMSELDERAAERVLCTTSSDILRNSLETGDLETAAPILVQRALWKAMEGVELEEKDDEEKKEEEKADEEEKHNIEKEMEKKVEEEKKEEEEATCQESSVALNNALKTGELDVAGEVLASRALRDGLTEVSPKPISAITSDPTTDESFSLRQKSGSEIAQEIATDRAFSAPVPTGLSEPLISQVESIQSIKSEPNMYTTPKPAQSSVTQFTVPVDCIPAKEQEKQASEPTLTEGIHFLEKYRTPGIEVSETNPGLRFTKAVIAKIQTELQSRFEDDKKCGFKMISKPAQDSDFNEVAKILVKSALDCARISIASANEDKRSKTKFAILLCRQIFVTSLETLREAPGLDLVVEISEAIVDHLRDTLTSVGISNEAVLSIVIGKCIGTLINANTKHVRRESSVELFEACFSGDPVVAGEILVKKTLKEAENRLGDIGQFRSTSDILTEGSSSGFVKPSKSKRKINMDGLPPPRHSFVSHESEPTPSSRSYEPIRDMLLAEEREAHMSRIVSSSYSNSDLREEMFPFRRRISDISLPLPENAETQDYVRRIQSKDHVYYIDRAGQIKKKMKKKRSRRRLSKDDLNLHLPDRIRDVDALPELSDEPHTITSEVALVHPSPPASMRSDASKKSLEVRRSSFKRRESSLQMIAVINSSYSNMQKSRGSGDEVHQMDQEDLLGQVTHRHSSEHSNMPYIKSIEELLSDNDRELLQKLSKKSTNKEDDN